MGNIFNKKHFRFKKQIMAQLPSIKFGQNESLNQSKFGLNELEQIQQTNSKTRLNCRNGMPFEKLFLPKELKNLKYSDFNGPFIKRDSNKNSFTLPYCYYSREQSLKTSTFSKLPIKTLFYIFYNMPRDQLQCFSAME